MHSAAIDERLASYTAIRSEIVNLVPSEARQILDVGCSNGALGKHLKTMLEGRKVFGIEFDQSFAEVASRHLDGVVNADLNTMDWPTVLPDQIFDCMIFADVLEHLVDPRRSLTLALERLTPGGSVVISLPNVRHVSAFWSIFVMGVFPQRDRGLFDRTHLRWFTYSDAKALLLDHGLKISSESFALRWRDRGGGFLNRMLNRLPSVVQRWAPFREFLSYQICFRATVTT